jgi:hypothetical protein
VKSSWLGRIFLQPIRDGMNVLGIKLRDGGFNFLHRAHDDQFISVVERRQNGLRFSSAIPKPVLHFREVKAPAVCAPVVVFESLLEIQLRLGVSAADAGICHQPDRVLQISFAQNGQSIGQPVKQIGPIRFAQRNDDSSVMSRESQWNSMEEVFVRHDRDCVLVLSVSK